MCLVFSGLLTAARKTAVLCPRQRCLWLVRRLWLTEGWTYPVTLWISLTNPSVRFRPRKTKRRRRPKMTLRSKTKAVENVMRSVVSSVCSSLVLLQNNIGCFLSIWFKKLDLWNVMIPVWSIARCWCFTFVQLLNPTLNFTKCDLVPQDRCWYIGNQ